MKQFSLFALFVLFAFQVGAQQRITSGVLGVRAGV
jgi:hypothetical protein